MFYNHAKVLLFISLFLLKAYGNAFCQWNPNYSIGTQTGNYVFNYTQTPDKLVEINPSVYGTASLTYQWYQSTTPLSGFVAATGTSTSSTYTFTAPIPQTLYFYRAVKNTSNGTTVNSNTIKIQVASVNWENRNYVRTHEVLTTGITNWKTVDQLSIGQKLQTTTYADGLGRISETVSRETATPSTGTLWGDIIQFSSYDLNGREPKQYLPYTMQYATTSGTESGKYKASPTTNQAQYYTNTYNETSPYSTVTYENNSLNRVSNVKESGTSWAASSGNAATYDMNSSADNVRIFTTDYVQGDAPVDKGVYADKTLFKTTYTDVNGKQVIEYTNQAGQLILKKAQVADAPSASHSGWICTYFVYDDFGLLRFQLQPEAVKYLDANSWSFAGTNGTQVLNELCFQYNYDSKGRTIWKKAPGAKPLQMIYDTRDRVVFMQDGNQAALSTPQWTANLYDDLDRLTLSTLYNTTETVSQLQTDIASATTTTTVSTTPPSVPIADLVVSNRNASINTYSAQNSVTLADGFVSGTNDAFTVQISGTAATTPAAITSTTYNNPISSANLNNASVCTILKYLFYDTYSFSNKKPFDNVFNNTTAYSTIDPNVIAIATSKRTISYPTGSLIRVLGTSTFLASTDYYDEKGRHIQTLEDNIKTGTNVTTMQYHWDGRLLSTCNNHTAPGTDYIRFITLTKNIYDKIGRVTSIQKQVGSNNTLVTVTAYDYDDMGRLKTKHLDPGYTGSGKTEMEALAYSYNIHNNITGINKDYALKTSGYNKCGNFFGLYLGFDNKDNVFSAGLLDGHVAGQLWNTQGDDAQRKYDYTYDNAGRLSTAIFKERQKTTDAWDNSKMNFSVTDAGTGSAITYDLNGNLLSMYQKGVMPGTAAPADIDKLSYTYTAYSNKLIKVTDNTTQTSTNGQQGDFKDGTNGAANDYVYDNNGNVVIDLNKNAKDLNNVAGANGIFYNYLDKPERIRIAGKGAIRIVYDADGNKLQKIYTPEGSSIATVTTYINEFVYKETAASNAALPVVTGTATLQYINFEEGRIRVMTPVSASNGYDALTIDGNMALPNGKEGVYDFFIRDYQQNVRMILTDEVHTGSNKCTMEAGRATAEEPIFGQVDANGNVTGSNEERKTRFAVSSIPGQAGGGGWQNSSIGNSVSRVGNSLAAGKVGPNVLLKVMAGDALNATTQYYYQNPVTNTNTPTTLTQDIITSLIAAITGSGSTGSTVKGGTAGINTQLTGNAPFGAITEPDRTNTAGTSPKAYLTVLFFDERFNYVTENSAFVKNHRHRQQPDAYFARQHQSTQERLCLHLCKQRKQRAGLL